MIAPFVSYLKRVLQNIGTALLCLCVVCLAIEGVFTVYYLCVDRRFISVGEKLRAEQNTHLDFLTRNGARTLADTLFPHPWLGFVHHPGAVDNGLRVPVNSSGFFGHEFPLRKQPGEFVILVTGGSVASEYAGLDQEHNILEQALNAYYTNDRITKFVVLNGGIGSWKQPQQMILFALYAHAIDGVITLDGFNENGTLIDPNNRLRIDHPGVNYVNNMNNYAGSWRVLLPLYLDGMLSRAQRQNVLLRRSKALYFLITRIRAAVRARASAPDAEAYVTGTLNAMYTFPADWDGKMRVDWQLEQYRNTIRAMHAIAERFGVRSLFFMQPAPCAGKELTDEEKKVAGDLGYANVYWYMEANLLRLQKEGVPFFSLGACFYNVPETVYTDKIHLTPKGYRVINSYILDRIENVWGLRPSR